MAYEIYRQTIEAYSEREPDLVPPKPHFYAIVYAGDGRDKGMLRVDCSAYSGELAFSIYAPDPEGDGEPFETVSVPTGEVRPALDALVSANAAARRAEDAAEADRAEGGPGE